MSESVNQPSGPSVNQYERERREKLQALKDLGVDPYGGPETGLCLLASIRELYAPEMGHDGGPAVKTAGRIVLKRDMGKLSFLTLRDETGDLQVALDKKRLDEKAWAVNSLLDLGDQIVVEGALGVTKKGEITIWATALRLAAKSLLPPPGKWDGLSDIETRYRQRYVDLWANPEVMHVMKLRGQIIQEIRSYLTGRGFVEVETSMMQPMAGGAAAKPFTTHHNALDIPLYLRIAPELYLKRLLVGGFTKVFELNRNFRNEGISPRHNPEFTMLEAYEAFGSWETMADLVEGMICHIAEKLFGGLSIEHRDDEGEVVKTINLARPWPRKTMAELVEKFTGWVFRKQKITDTELWEYQKRHRLRVRDHFIAAWPSAGHFLDPLRHLSEGTDFDLAVENVCSGLQLAANKHIDAMIEGGIAGSDSVPAEALQTIAASIRHNADELLKQEKQLREQLNTQEPAEQLQTLYEKAAEPKLKDPCFVIQVPSVIIPLAKKNAADPFFADVYELAINGQEISPGYSELNDPDVQAANFAHQVGDEAEQQKTDEDFLTALKFGMPPAGGLGLGIDRLVMMLTGAESIRDVILFPLMKPQS